MPHPNQSTIAAFKRVMITRMPECKWTQEDVQSLMEETGMSKAFIYKWADNFRSRYTNEEERSNLLLNNKQETVTELRTKRVFFLGFQLEPSVISTFVYKPPFGTEMKPSYICAGFDKETSVGEVYMEFPEIVRDNLFIEQLEEHGAWQVMTFTFKNDDEASDALARVLHFIDKTGVEYTYGKVKDTLMQKAVAKNETNKWKASIEDEFNEKTAKVLIKSMEDVDLKVDELKQGVCVQIPEQLGGIGTSVVKMEQSICTVIPDYQRENEELKNKLVHKTKEVDRIEYNMGLMTRKNNLMIAEVEGAKEAVKVMEVKVADRDNTIQLQQDIIKSLREQIDQLKVMDNARWIMEHTDRELKRPRMD